MVPRTRPPQRPDESRVSTRRRARAVIAFAAAAVALALVLLVLAPRLLPGAPAPPASPAPSAPTLAPLAPLAPPAAPVEDRAPEIRGRILDADGNPVEGAAVRLVAPAPPYASYRETTTDAAGAFALARVSQPLVRVVADRDPRGIVTSAELRVEKTTTDVTLVLSAGSAVRGTVVDGDDHPIAGATLSADGAPWIVRRATSDADGAFRLTTVPLEAGAIVAVARGFKTARATLARRTDGTEIAVRVRMSAAPGVRGDVRDADGNPVKARVVACDGQPAEVRIATADDGTFELPASAIGCTAVAEHDDYGASDPALVPEGGTVSLRLKSGGSIEGVVVDDRGRALPQFDLGIESFTTPRGRPLRGGARRAFQDTGGSFLWEKLAPGSYVLTASSPGRPPTRSDAIAVSPGAATRGVRIVLPGGGNVTGRVLDESGRAVAGADLLFDAVSSVLESKASAKSDDSGRYRLEGAPAGPFTLRVQRDGFRARMISGLRVASGASLTQDVRLTTLDGGATFEFGGIGAGLAQTPDGIAFGGVFPGSPAARAGLLPGDRIVWIDGQDVGGLSVADVLQLLRGQPGTSVGVGVRRPATGQEVDVVIERGTIVR